MQLIACYIENFGKFSKFSMTFTDGINEIADENGWGKSTLAAFIKVMLYGFDDEKKRSGEKERKKYEPWQGGEYGGRLTIRTEKGTFIICRTFGKTEKTDEFKLLDASTGAETSRFGREIGRELLRIDRDTFFNTLYISQADRKAEVTNDIHARIGSQDHILEDISGYEEVEKRIKEQLNHANPRRKGGFLCDMQRDISEKRREQEKRAGLEEAVETRKKQLGDERHRKAELQRQAEDLREQRSRISAYERLAEKKKRYVELLAEEEARHNALAEAASRFPGNVPARAQQLHLQELAEQMQEEMRRKEQYRLTEGEQEELRELSRRFSDQSPSQETLQIYENKRAALQQLRMELASQSLTEDEEDQLREGQEIFGDEVLAEAFDQQIQNARDCKALSDSIRDTQVTLRAVAIACQQTEQERQAKRRVFWQLTAGAVCALAGIGAALFWNRIGGAALFLAGLALVLWGLCAGKKNAQEKEKTPADALETAQLKEKIAGEEQRRAQLLRELHQFLEALHGDCPDQETEGRLYELKEKYSAYKRVFEKKRTLQESGKEGQAELLHGELYQFLKQYMPLCTEDERMFDSAIRQLEQDMRRYEQLCSQNQSWQRAGKAAAQAQTALDEAFHALSMEPGRNVPEQLRQMQEDIQHYEHCVREAEEASKRVRDFSDQEHVGELLALKEPEDVRSLQELDRQIREKEEQAAGCDELIAEYSRTFDACAEELDALDAAAGELEELEEQYKRVSGQYEILKLTQQYLDEAKTNLTNRYTKPLLDSLKKYYEILSNGEECHYAMDANMKVSLDIGSIPKDLSALSMGYQDLSWLCMRLAFIDAMYHDEKPFLIMDDPLVNMDEKKIEGGKALLTQLASEYQVLYFTCHKSRSISSPANI